MKDRQLRHGDEKQEKAHGHSHWLMIACCVPMLVIAVALAATGVASPTFVIGAVVCTVMMALMMGGMHGSGGRDGH